MAWVSSNNKISRVPNDVDTLISVLVAVGPALGVRYALCELANGEIPESKSPKVEGWIGKDMQLHRGFAYHKASRNIAKSSCYTALLSYPHVPPPPRPALL